jgi:hypothetical protein
MGCGSSRSTPSEGLLLAEKVEQDPQPGRAPVKQPPSKPCQQVNVGGDDQPKLKRERTRIERGGEAHRVREALRTEAARKARKDAFQRAQRPSFKVWMA